MEGDNKKGNMCGCGGISWGHHRGYRLAKKVFYLVVLIAVFCFGIQLGELKTLSHIYRGYSGDSMMGGQYGNQ